MWASRPNVSIVIRFLRMKFVGKILVKAYEKGEIEEDRKELRKAYRPETSLLFDGSPK